MNPVHYSSKSDEWKTPQDLFDELNNKFHFTLDPACQIYNAKCPKFYTPEQDGLKQSWVHEIVFLNPPYRRSIKYWIKKAYEESFNGATVICLIPTRTDTAYFHDYCFKASEIR